MTENNFVSSKKPFLCGVCEGFYGKPWTFFQRQELFKRMHRFGMNAYLYAPKDDYKHRLYWRDLYTEDEAEELRFLISGSEGNIVKFIYAISPGLDIVYSSASDVLVLKKKLDQVRDLGCQSFALLFDDIEDELCSEDITKFASIADAQCFLTNEIYNHLNQPDLFLFCPTEYCSSRSLPEVLKSTYLKTVGLRLDPRIEFLWTGPKVVSKRITAENVREVGGVVRRLVTVWDNLHANDYDQTRLYLGPYSGRPMELLDCLRGVLTNPNCEFEANFIALHTLAQWSSNTVTRFPLERQVTMTSPPHGEAYMEVEEEVVESERALGDMAPPTKPNGDGTGYEPRKALQAAVADWLPELYKTKSPFGQQVVSRVTSDSDPIKQHDQGNGRPMEEYYEEGKVQDLDLEGDSNCGKEEDQKKMDDEIVPMVADDEGQQAVEMTPTRREDDLEDEEMKSKMASDDCDVKGSTAPENQAYQSQQTSVVGGFYYDCRKRQHDTALIGDEVTMICDFFYLPFEHGPTGDEMLKAATWLVDNFDLVYRSAPFPCYGGGGPRLAPFMPQLSDSLSPCSSSPPESPISDRTTSPLPPPTLPLLGQPVVPGQQKGKPDKSVVFVNASLSTSTTLVGSTVIPVAGRVSKNRFLHDTYLNTPSASEWYERAIRFHDGYGDLSAVVDKLVNIPNRELLYELYKYVNDMRSNLALVNSYIKWHGIDKREKELFKSGEQEPWVHRGGLLAEFRRLLPFDRDSLNTRGSNVFVVRPCYAKDRGDVNSICLRTYNDSMDASYWLGSMPNLVGDCKIGAFLNYFSKFSYVLEDDLGICGYVVAADDIKKYRNHLEKTWLPEMRNKYPIVEMGEKKSAQASVATANEPLANQTEDLRELSSAHLATSVEEAGISEQTTREDTSKDEGPCPMSSSEQSRSGSPIDLVNFSVFESLGTAGRLKSQALSIEALLKALHSDHKPVLKEEDPIFAKYPSPVSLGLLSDKGLAAKMLLASVEQALANEGSEGMHVILPASHKASIEMYKKLGFREEKSDWSEPKSEARKDGAPDDKNPRRELLGLESTSIVLCKSIDVMTGSPREDGFNSTVTTGFDARDNQQLSDQIGMTDCSNVITTTTITDAENNLRRDVDFHSQN